jgi:hypothetical protein
MLRPSIEAWLRLRESTLDTISILIELAEPDEPDRLRENLTHSIDLLALSVHPFDSLGEVRQ